MGMDKDTKAVFDRHHNEQLESMKEIKRDLQRVNETCDKLRDDNISLKAENVNLKAELATANVAIAELKGDLAQHKTESAAAIKAAVQKAVDEHKAVIAGLKVDIDDLEQYGRRKSIRVQNVVVVAGESDDDNQDLLLNSVNERLAPANIRLEHRDIIRFHRSSASKDDLDNLETGGKVSQVLIKLKNWPLSRRFQGLNSRMRLKENTPGFKGCRVYHDLTKRRLALLNEARAACKNGWFAYADANCNLKLRNGDKFLKFNTSEELAVHIATL